MKVILLKSVAKLGVAGEIKKVSDGYGRNYLLPHNLAKEVDSAIVNKVQAKLANQKRNKLKQSNEINKIIKQLTVEKVVLEKKANELGHLFAQVKEEEIMNELAKKYILSHVKRINVPTIKATGEFFCQIIFQGGEVTKLKILIKPLN